MENPNSFFGFIQIAIGAYLVYCGITGNGQLYRAENIKKGKEALFKKRMRLIALILGPVMLANGVVDYALSDREWHAYLSGGLWAVSLVLVVIMFVISIKLADRSKKPAKPGAPKSAPRSAFYFDEDTEDKGN